MMLCLNRLILINYFIKVDQYVSNVEKESIKSPVNALPINDGMNSGDAMERSAHENDDKAVAEKSLTQQKDADASNQLLKRP
jgi:hypothetical protein